VSYDVFVGFDDLQSITGTKITSELSVFDSEIKIGDTYKHVSEKGGKRVSSANAYDGP
jgi:hypothetical protein